MGRPIKKKWFGQTAAPGAQIAVTGAMFSDGVAVTNAYIVSQTGDNAYMVQDTLKTHAPEILFMVNANSVGALLPGQCFINATVFGSGAILPAKKIQQYRITLFNVANAVPTPTGVPSVSPVSNYTWSTIPATKVGQVTLLLETGGTGIVDTVAVTTPPSGAGYFVAPTVTFPAGAGGGTGATATATIVTSGANAGKVSGVTLVTPGYGYTAGALTFSAPPASVTATATATVTGGVVTAITVANGGGYYAVAPAVTLTPTSGGTGATATAVISGGKVVGVTIGGAGGTGYLAAPTVAIAAPPAAATAVGTFTVKTVAGLLEAPTGEEEAPDGEGTPEAESAKSSFRKSELKAEKAHKVEDDGEKD